MSLINRLIDKRIAAYQSDLIRTHYAEVESMYSQVRGGRHDWRNHIQMMKSYAAAGDLEGIRRYLDALEGDLKTIEPAVRTGNSMTDAILNSKISLARSRNIPVTIDAHIPVTLTTPEIDLCVIIGNLFDNAIEASLPLPPEQRMIRVYMDMKRNNQLYISFTNLTATGKQNKENGLFRTAKGDGHGFGLKRIDGVVERHGGYLSRNSEDGAFTTEVLLPQ